MGEASIKKASLITGVSKYINIFLGILFSAILSRILTPNDYGIVAIVTVFSSFFIVLSNCGLGIAVIQRKEFCQDDINSLFTFSIYFGLALTFVFILLAYPICLFFNNKVYLPICLLLSVSIFFNSINAIPDGLLRREKKFFLIGLRLIVVSLLTYGITIVLAIFNFKYYALVIQSVVSSLLIFLWNLKNIKVRFVRKVNWNILKSIFSYSGYNFLFNFLNYFSRNLDKLIIGKSLGNEALAQYNKAYHFMLYPVQNLTNVISPTLHPILSDYQNDKHIIYDKYMKVVKLLSLIGVLVTAVCFICSDEIIAILYGAQWKSAAVCFKYMSLAIWTQMIGGTTGSIFAALNDTKSQFFVTVFNTAIIIFALIAGAASKDIQIISLYISIALISHFFTIYYILIKKTMEKPFSSFLSAILPDFSILIILCTLMWSITHFISIQNNILSFIVKGSIITVIYILLLSLFKQWKHFIPLLPSKLKNKLVK